MRRTHTLLLGVALGTLFAERAARAEGEAISLAAAIEIGRRHAPELRAAKTNAESEAAQDDVARANYYPSFVASLGGQGLGTRGTQPLPPPATGVFGYVSYAGAANGGLNVQWTLYDFGKTGGAVANADAQYAAAVATVAATDITVISNVANAYMNLVYGEKLRDIAKTTLDERERLVVLAKGLVKNGLQPPLEEIRASARAEAARRDLASAEATAFDTRAVLAALLGVSPTATFRVSLPHLPRLTLDPAAAMREADRLPVVVAAYALVDAKRGVEDANRSRYLPTIAFQGSASYTLTRFDTERATQTAANGTAGLTLTETLFDPSIAPGIDAAHANTANAQAIADQARRDAREEAARAALGLRSADAMLEHAHKAAEAAAGVLTIVQARYLQGLSSPLELIEAETADSDARTAEGTDELAFAIASVRLYVATGRKIQEEP